MMERKTTLARRWSLVLGSSVAAVAAASASPAWAQCNPDPTMSGGVTNCTGSDPDGLRITTDRTTVQVAASANVTGSSGPAISVDIAHQPDTFGPRTTTITVGGRVDGGAQSGIAVLSGSVQPSGWDFSGTLATVIVEAGGTVAGASGITAGPSAGNVHAPALVNVTNAGTISGTGGVALRATDPARSGFQTISNAQQATIGAIVGAVGDLTNAGLIDGGALSAVDQTTTYNSGVYPGAWSNSGSIRSASAAATIANLTTSFDPLTNSGTIANTGMGAAIAGRADGYGVEIHNLAGGAITTAGQTAIVASSVTLINAGTIKGDIVTVPSFGFFNSTIDSTRGTIQGNVTLTGGNNLVYGRYDGTATLHTGITGTINPGAGTNSLVLAPSTDLVVSTAINLPAGFQRLRLDPEAGATLTLVDGFVAPGTIELAGQGTIANNAAITTNGQAFVVPYSVSGAPSLTNAGSITTAGTQGYYAVDLDYGATLTNSGTITSSGYGVNGGNKVINTGTIAAANTALSLFGGSLENSGTIRSTQGIGIFLTGNTDNTPAINSGRIEGATYGAVIGYVLSNSGTISATGSGTAVGLSNYGVLNNLAGGIVSGGAYAVAGSGPGGIYNGTVFNAGTINGDVDFVAGTSGGYTSRNTFVALAGGVLNGNLTLGNGDTLVTDLVASGPGPFAGINGTVTATGGLLRYRVSADASAVIGAVGPFATTGYELSGGARLTLTANAPQTLPLVLAGNGTVDLTADIAAINRAPLTVTAAALAPGTAQGSTRTLTIVNRGTLSGTITDYFSGAFGVVQLGTGNALQNEGTIRAAYTATNGGTSFNAGAAFGGTLINNGRIELEGSYGAYSLASLVNTGTIMQTGTRTAYGTYDVTRVTNSGTIQTAGTAIQGAYEVTNSGTIASIGSIAISNFGSGTRITNAIGGTIIGGNGIAIRAGGAVVNAGTIIGNVDLSSGSGSGSGSGYGNVYYANGGTLAGDLTFGGGDDLFLQSGPVAGVSGTIDAGAGHDIYGLALTSSGSVAVAAAAGFEDAMVAALGADTVATVTGIDASFTDFYAVGDGTVVNQAALAGRVVTGSASYSGQTAIVGETLGTLVNAGSIAGGVSGSVTRIANTGTISATGPGVATIATWGAGLILDNAGRIEARGPDGIAIQAPANLGFTVRNTGTIVGAVALGGGADIVENSGVIGPVYLGAGDDAFRVIGGRFASIVAGGAGSDVFEVASGEAALDAISEVEQLRVSSGLAVISESVSFDTVALTGGQLVGRAGSTITAPTISVAQGATFGSAGTVNGNVTVAGVLSPGASPGTMTVNGNVSLAGSSVSLFEITSSVSDKLIVNGTLAIAAGATLRIEASQAVVPGQLLDLIVADSITGSFTDIVLPASLAGLLVQQDDTIALLGQFQNDASFAPQIERSIDYVNDLLRNGQASAAFLAAVPGLITASGTSDPAAFARLTPEAYASAGQIAVEQGLELANAARGDALATQRDTPGAFSFASALGDTRTLDNSAQGVARAHTSAYGFLGGFGWGSRDWSIAGLLGYLDSRQTLAPLDARTDVDAIVVAVHGRWTKGKLGLKAMVGYAAGDARTHRNLPGGTAKSAYGLTSWTGDFSVDYTLPLSGNWAFRPALGVTAIRTRRDGVTEAGGSVYALAVAGERDDAVFVDGTVTFRGGLRDGANARPYLSIGMRYQAEGRTPFAIAALGIGDLGLSSAGAQRAPMLATARVGADLNLTSRLVLFGAVNGEAGDADLQASARVGLRLAF